MYLTNAARRVAPVWARRAIHRRLRSWLPETRRWSRFEAGLRQAGIVRSGPFAGLKYGSDASWGSPLPLLLGSYESELHEVFAQAIAAGYDTVIDVGSAEGYYAVGLALRIPAAHVYAFDLDPNAQQMCRAMAERNQVSDRVQVGGSCTAEVLETLISGRTLIVSDCEGYETQLLDPLVAPALAISDVVVELHDFIDATISTTITSRFAKTHDVQMVDARPRDASEHGSLARLGKAAQQRALDEHRPVDPHPMQWAVMRARR